MALTAFFVGIRAFALFNREKIWAIAAFSCRNEGVNCVYLEKSGDNGVFLSV